MTGLGLGLCLGLCDTGGGSSPTPPFSPPQSASLLGWFDASDAITITDTSGFVTQWDDKSGNSNHYTSSGSARPTTGADTINSLNVLTFDGSSTFMDRADALGLTGNPAYTLITVFELDAGAVAASDDVTFALGANGTAGQCIGHREGDASTRYNDGFISFPDRSDSTVYMSIWQKPAAGQYNSTTLRTNGVAQTIDGSSNPTDTVNLLDITSSIGARKNTTGSYVNHFDGKIAEIFIYDTVLSSADLNTIGAYLAAKWGFSYTTI